MTIENTDLLKELSETELIQLSDINATGAINQTVVDDAIADALSFIESFFALPTTPTPLLKKIAVDLTIYELRRKNNLLDESLREARKEWETYLLKMAKGLIPTASSATGTTPAPKKAGASFKHARPIADTSGLRMP